MDAPRLEPESLGGYPVWRRGDHRVRVAFVGQGEPAERAEIFRRTQSSGLPVAWLRQVHGASCLEGAPGYVGAADALVSDRLGLAMAISTADCVPVVVARGGRLTAIHAGWRGIVADVVSAGVERLDEPGGEAAAWIGPAIGPCCYEVGAEVARQVVDASAPGVDRQGAPGKRNLDLQAAVRAQLARLGIHAVDTVRACTRCRADLHSYRRDGAGAGRNLTFAWLSEHA